MCQNAADRSASQVLSDEILWTNDCGRSSRQTETPTPPEIGEPMQPRCVKLHLQSPAVDAARSTPPDARLQPARAHRRQRSDFYLSSRLPQCLLPETHAPARAFL